MVVCFFAEACSNSSTLLLDHRSLVGNGLCCAHITDELLHYNQRRGSNGQLGLNDLMASPFLLQGFVLELIVMARGAAQVSYGHGGQCPGG